MIERATATDISPGMLARLAGNASPLGLEVRTAAAEAETLPFPDESFDLVFGHAVLHHIPDLEQAFSEFARVLRPGGTLAFCGEPSRYGDLLAAIPKRTALIAAPFWRRAVRASQRHAYPDAEPNGQSLEGEVDVHAFSPGDLQRFCATAGLSEVRVRGEELLASIHGWTVRTLEATAEPDDVPVLWRRFAFRSYLALQRAGQPGARAAPACAALLQPAGGGAQARGLAAPAGLFFDQPIRPGKRLEALVRDRVAADDRLAVAAVLEPLLRPLDRLERALEVVADRVVLAGLVEIARLIAGVLRLLAWLLRPNRRELALDPRALFGKPLLCSFRVHDW